MADTREGEEAAAAAQHRVTFRMMLLDAKFIDAPSSARCVPPTVHLYGVTPEGHNVCCNVHDFLPYFWFPAPITTDGSCNLGEESIQKLSDYINEHVLASKKKHGIEDCSFVSRVTLAYRTPLMYYRPGGPFKYLKVELWRSKDIGVVSKELTALAQGKQLEHIGLIWNNFTCYEDEIKLGMRFFCDTHIAGGSWLEVQSASIIHYSLKKSRCHEEFVASWCSIKGLTPDATQFMEFSCVSEQNKIAAHSFETSDNVEGNKFIIPSSSAMKEGHRDHTYSQVEASTESESLALSPLRVLVLNVLAGRLENVQGSVLRSTQKTSSTRPKRQKLTTTTRGKNVNTELKSPEPSSDDAVCDIENISTSIVGTLTVGKSLLPSRDPVLAISMILIHQEKLRKIVFIHGTASLKSPSGVELHLSDTEPALLKAWQEFFISEADPDIVCVYQLKDSIRYLLERFRVLKLGSLDISRFRGRATEVKSVVSYEKNWVKQQQRMTATSNQEVFRASIEGRVVIDMLRVVLIAYNLSTFTLGECCQVFLGKTKEYLNPTTLAELWQGHHGGASRLINYSLHEAEVILELMQKLEIIHEIIEMARVTGLSISDSLYKAQMVRVQSLLLRSAHKEGWLLGGPTINGQLSESPYLLHPKDAKTAGFYKDPVAILDFASLYPSVYMAHNLCYTTLVHPQDVQTFSEGSLMRSPTGAHFVVPSVRRGVLPRICGALITARKLTKDAMYLPNITSSEYAVLDARQKALKLCSNALYGFTGAGASPQQALPLADSCLSMGAAACRHAVQLVGSMFENARVIYAQTDSVFIQFLGASIKEAVQLGQKAAELISEAFPAPMTLKFEKVLCPFLLLQVNRYAGKDVSTLNSGNGALFVRGIESERRDVPLFVRTVCRSALQDIILNEDVNRALLDCKHEIRRLVSGKCSMVELVMTGGLWRVDHHDISRLASSIKSPKKELGGPSTAEEGRGPHVALAVRLKQKDPDRQFHIGERIQYVLVENSSKLQDNMAEDPIDAIRGNMQLNVQVYLENKLRKPLESILEHVADHSSIHDLFNISHNVSSPFLASKISHGNQSSMRKFFKSQSSCLSCRKRISGNQETLCKECSETGAPQATAISLISEKREIERKLLTGQAECFCCHSGGLFNPILCTNTDCPIFYIRCESLQPLQQLHCSLEKLELTCKNMYSAHC